MLGFGILIPLVPYMADRFGVPPQLITPILGSYSLCQLLGGVLAGKDPARADFLAPALVSALLSVLAILLVRFALPESHTAEHRRLHAGEPRRGALRLLRERPALATLAAATLLVTYSQERRVGK